MNPDSPPILVVEDEPQIRRFVRGALEREGFRVCEASTAAGALAVAAQVHPAVTVLDLGLPDRDGLTFIRDLRLWSRAPIVVLSARSGERDKVEALDAGADVAVDDAERGERERGALLAGSCCCGHGPGQGTNR
jgi:two-component system KDP operon response regulator KdpE